MASPTGVVNAQEAPPAVDDARRRGEDLPSVPEVPEYRCRDELGIPASRLRCFEVLAELSTHARWWTLVTVTSRGDTSRLSPGVRFDLAGARPGGERVEWSVEVLEIEVPARIELSYAGGEYRGTSSTRPKAARLST
jgi:hypothetical protein